VFVFCSKPEMNNYQQFNVRPQLNARFAANTRTSNFNNSNFHNPALGTRLLSPAVAHANQQMYGALHSNTPVIATDGTAGYSAVGQAAFSPMYVMNCHPGMAVVPGTPFDFWNQPSGLRRPANFPDTADLPREYQCVTENAAVFQNQMPAVHPQAVCAGQMHNIHSLPRVPVTDSKVENTASLLSDDVQIPFRQVQWVPPAVQETGVPLIPYAVEIKPQIDGTPENQTLPESHVLFGDVATTDTTVPANGANCDTVCANDKSVPAADLDIATDSGSHNPNTRTASVSSDVGGVNELTVENDAEETGTRKRRQSESYSGVKSFKLHDEEIIKPCSVSLVRLDSTIVTHQCKSDDNIDQLCVADDQEINKSVTEIRPVPVQEKEQELLNNDDAALSPSTLSEASEPDALIRSDEDVDGDAPLDDDACLLNASSEKSECHQMMPTNSEALLLDMECDDETDSEALRVIVPTKNVEKATLKTPSSLPETAESKRSHERPTASHSSAIPIYIDAADFSSTVAVEPQCRTRSQRSAARACKDKISVLFDMERDSERDDEQLHVMLPTRNLETTCAKTAWSLPEIPQLRQLHKPPATSRPNVIPINLDVDDFSVTVVLEPEGKTANTAMTTLQRLAAIVTAYRDKTYATQNQLQAIKIKRSENSLLDVPLHSARLLFLKDSSQEFRLLLLDTSFIPRNVLAQLTNLVSSSRATTDDERCSPRNVIEGVFGRTPDGRSRKLLFQCLFCPHGEVSAKHLIRHVKQLHTPYASLIQRSLLPNCQTLLYIYCRHCNFVTYDSAVLFIHFAVYHKVAGIFLSPPKVVENDPATAPLVNPEDKAKEFPFHCCPDCGYIDVKWNRIIHHVLKEQSSESVFFGCVVRLVRIGHAGSLYHGSLTYKSLSREERHAIVRKEIYVCVSCGFFSFYPTYVLRHYVSQHSGLEMLYVCAASPCCPKRCATSDDIISHIQDVHVTMSSMQFRCTATLLDSLTLTQLDVSNGEMVAADVPVRVRCQSPSAFDGSSLEAAVEIVNDDE